MFEFLKKSAKNFVHTDLHSHLLPNIDDGVKSWEEAISLVRQFEELGYQKLIATPHVINDYYPNSKKDILLLTETLNQKLKENNIKVKIEAGAEYYLDEWFYNQVINDADLLSFGDGYILVETAFMNMPAHMKEVFFELKTKGYKPILAHPERYDFFIQDYEKIIPIVESGVLLQVNASSLFGYYSKESQKFANHLIENDWVSFIGSDVHNQKHFDNYKKALKSPLFSKLRETSILNNSL
ncbi:MAG: capsular biosynthesis protein [Reichenbachiella sp.]